MTFAIKYVSGKEKNREHFVRHSPTVTSNAFRLPKAHILLKLFYIEEVFFINNIFYCVRNACYVFLMANPVLAAVKILQVKRRNISLSHINLI